MITNQTLGDRILRAMLSTRARVVDRGRDDRGDVPGWVLITLMTAGIVTMLWAVAAPALRDLFSKAINGVSGP